MTPQNLELPVIHLNGSGIDSLYTQYRTAWRQLRDARESFLDTTCHPRDFYVKGDDAYHKAHSQRQVALHHIDSAISYLETHVQFLTEHRERRTPRNTSCASQNRSHMQ